MSDRPPTHQQQQRHTPDHHHLSLDNEFPDDLLSLLGPYSMSRRPIKPALDHHLDQVGDNKKDVSVHNSDQLDLGDIGSSGQKSLNYTTIGGGGGGGGPDNEDQLLSPTSGKKRKSMSGAPPTANVGAGMTQPAKRPRTNTPWTAAEEQRLKSMRDAGNSWSEIAKTFPTRTEGSVKKHWYKDMHYAEFGEDESQALLAAIREYDANKWKVIGQKVGKPAKACEQYAKEHFGNTGK
ncbi:Similar to Transcriptional activator Myb; acc. no. Q08759 [Pyronema omphalodes CBS 100304]|uniref:Similar to Transcriptional activator Myb acc. no. Q08759 n=1 Tax=Pyronema omphalodes (strain CBS 100304) TaxID=1076935 RepID=U4LBA6_PYROM|nr:Similar to Transcriptional activator Myb; acc. no. Q08759 [Pyronema omphalodes CBS 100304]